MMIDPFVLLTPVLLLAVFWLVRFVGCNWFYGLEPTEPETRPDPPTFDPPQGIFSQGLSVTLSDATANATIYYTTDNSQPTIPPTGSTQEYTGPITVSYTTLIKAIASAPSLTDNSFEASAAYIISPITHRQSRPNVLPGTNASAKVDGNAFNNAALAGDLIVVLLSYNSAAQSVANMTDSAGNVYQRAVGPTTGAGNLASRRQEIWFAKNISDVSGLVVTATFTQAFTGQIAISAHEYSGAHETQPFDVQSAAIGTSVAVASGPAATTTARLIFGGVLFENTNISQGAGFTARTFAGLNLAEDKTVSVPLGTVEATATQNTPLQWIAQMVAFK